MTGPDGSIGLGPGEQFAIMAGSQRNYSRDNFASNLRRMLGVHDLTVTQAAKLVGVSRATLSNWASGKSDPGLSSLERLCAFFEVDAFRLLGQWNGSFLMEQLADLNRWDRVEEKIRGHESARMAKR